MFGIITSARTRSGHRSNAASRASTPSEVVRTSYPAPASSARRSRAMNSSSSTTRIDSRADAWVSSLTGRPRGGNRPPYVRDGAARVKHNRGPGSPGAGGGTVQVLESFLDAMGNTPLVRLSRVAAGVKPTILAKLEMLNPGGSVKDRIGVRMIEAAEREGRLRPGGTIIEPTSGNTGHGLAIAAAIRGYKCIFVMPDKMSQEKVALLRAYGAEVVITPTAVAPESPESYYRVADRLTEEIPGAFQPNQYFNQENPKAHLETTGPEIWEQTEGTIDVLVAGVGTGGTITGAARYLKGKRPEITVVGADPEGSLYSGDTARPYLVEGIGEDFWPETFDPSVVDRWVRVSDSDSFRLARAVTRQEGSLVTARGRRNESESETRTHRSTTEGSKVSGQKSSPIPSTR